MVLTIINRLNTAFLKFDYFVNLIFKGGFPPQALCAIDINHLENWDREIPKSNSFSLKNIMKNGFLWAVPKHRHTIERRMKKRFGFPGLHWKLLEPKPYLITCHKCGHYHDSNTLCNHCYKIIKKETNEMQAAISEQLGLEPVEKEVIVLYENELSEKSQQYWKNQQIVEMPNKRPEWFHENLLQSTTQEPSESKEIKSNNLE